MRQLCPHCRKPIDIVVRPAGGAAKPAQGGVIGRLLGKSHIYDLAVQKFHQTAAPAVPIFRHGQQVEPEPESRSGPDVEPGQTRTAEVHRAPTWQDVMVPLLWSAVSAACVSILVATTQLAVVPIAESVLGAIAKRPVDIRLPWYLFAPAFGVSLPACWFYITKQALPVNLLASFEDIVGRDLNGDGKVGNQKPQAYRFRGQLDGGRTTIYTEFDITRPDKWHEFCQAITFDHKQFSGQEAARHKVPPDEFDRIKLQWASSDREKALVDPKSIGPQLTPQLTRMGRAMVRLFATTPPVADEV